MMSDDLNHRSLEKARVALVYDRVNKWGGAERIILALKKIFPQASLYTAVYNPVSASWAKSFRVVSSFLQGFPLARINHEFYPWLTPLAFESFDFSDFDIVISLTSAEAKGVITKPETLHLCYCLTPTRYLWSGRNDYFRFPGFGSLDSLARGFLRLIFPYLLRWDQVASQRPDYYLTISKNVKKRITKYYHRESKVIYPAIDIKKFQISNFKFQIKASPEKFFLVVSRLVPYKKVDLAIRAFNRLKLPLKIIGVGSQLKNLKKIAAANIEFLGKLTDKELIRYYYTCQAAICPQEEDFGLVPLEAQACGKPVISFKGGGALETVIAGKTGDFFYPQTSEALLKVVKAFESNRYDPDVCRKNAERFDQKIFIKKFKRKVETIWQAFQRKN